MKEFYEDSCLCADRFKRVGHDWPKLQTMKMEFQTMMTEPDGEYLKLRADSKDAHYLAIYAVNKGSSSQSVGSDGFKPDEHFETRDSRLHGVLLNAIEGTARPRMWSVRLENGSETLIPETNLKLSKPHKLKLSSWTETRLPFCD